MNRQTEIPEAIYDDEIVGFLAGRYQTSPREVLQRFLEQDGPNPERENGGFRLEENEMAILRDLTASFHP